MNDLHREAALNAEAKRLIASLSSVSLQDMLDEVRASGDDIAFRRLPLCLPDGSRKILMLAVVCVAPGSFPVLLECFGEPRPDSRPWARVSLAECFGLSLKEGILEMRALREGEDSAALKALAFIAATPPSIQMLSEIFSL